MSKKEEILTLNQIEGKLGKEKNKKDFLKKFIKNNDYSRIKKELVKLAYTEIIPSDSKPLFHLTYDSFSEGLEPIYFWLLDFMRDNAPGGLNLEVFKGKEDFEASAASGYFSEMGGKKTQMQQKAADYLGAINQVIKSILNLIYDLKDFEIKLKHYERYRSDSKEEKDKGRMALKFVWMDKVDVQNGAASINALAQNLNFPTLRPAFLQVKGDDSKDLEKFSMNENVKTILKRKFIDFYDWIDHSEKEIRNRYNIEKSYLKSQVGTLKLYAKWAKPYLVAAQKLHMKEFNTPDIVNAFSNMQMELELFGKKEVKPDSLKFKNLKTDRKFYGIIRVHMKFRTIPQAVQGQGGRQYIHGGRTDITFYTYAFDDVDLEILNSKELYEDMELIDQWVDTSLEQLQKEIDKYVTGEEMHKEPEKPKETPKFENPFKGTFEGFKEIFSPLKEIIKPKPSEDKMYKDTINNAGSTAESTCKILYTVYKKTHGMLEKE